MSDPLNEIFDNLGREIDSVVADAKQRTCEKAFAFGHMSGPEAESELKRVVGEREAARAEVRRLAAELEGYATYKTRTAEAESNRLQAESRAAEALAEKHAALQRAQEYIESANRAHDERDALKAELADSRKRMADVIAEALIENEKLRRILSHVPGKIALKAKEDAGYWEAVVPKAGVENS